MRWSSAWVSSVRRTRVVHRQVQVEASEGTTRVGTPTPGAPRAPAAGPNLRRRPRAPPARLPREPGRKSGMPAVLALSSPARRLGRDPEERLLVGTRTDDD